jgi:hypothetical protein
VYATPAPGWCARIAAMVVRNGSRL